MSLMMEPDPEAQETDGGQINVGELPHDLNIKQETRDG